MWQTAKHPATERGQEVLSEKHPQFHHTWQTHPKPANEILRALSCVKPVPSTSADWTHTVMKYYFFWSIIHRVCNYNQLSGSYEHKGSWKLVLCHLQKTFPSYPQMGQSRMIIICPYIVFSHHIILQEFFVLWQQLKLSWYRVCPF